MQEINQYSFHCGAIDALNAVVSAGVKSLALSCPMESAAERDALAAFTRANCRKYGTQFYIEDSPLFCDLFPQSQYRGKFLFLLYQADHILEQYLRLKSLKQSLMEKRVYFGGNRSRIALEFGRLLSYNEETIHRLTVENTDKEPF